MTFELVRMGWPNTVAILALALTPLAALSATVGQQPETVQVQQIQPEAVCQAADACAVVVAAADDAGLE